MKDKTLCSKFIRGPDIEGKAKGGEGREEIYDYRCNGILAPFPLSLQGSHRQHGSNSSGALVLVFHSLSPPETRNPVLYEVDRSAPGCWLTGPWSQTAQTQKTNSDNSSTVKSQERDELEALAVPPPQSSRVYSVASEEWPALPKKKNQNQDSLGPDGRWRGRKCLSSSDSFPVRGKLLGRVRGIRAEPPWRRTLPVCGAVLLRGQGLGPSQLVENSLGIFHCCGPRQ